MTNWLVGSFLSPEKALFKWFLGDSCLWDSSPPIGKRNHILQLTANDLPRTHKLKRQIIALEPLFAPFNMWIWWPLALTLHWFFTYASVVSFNPHVMQLPTRSTHQTLHLALFRCFASSSRSSSAACSANGAPINSAKKSSSRWSAQHVRASSQATIPMFFLNHMCFTFKKDSKKHGRWQTNEKRSATKQPPIVNGLEETTAHERETLYPISFSVTVYLRLFTIARWEGLLPMKQQDFIP